MRLDPRVRVWGGGSVLIGGAPWRVSRLAPAAAGFLARLADAGPGGVTVNTDLDRRIARVLLDRGFAHPLPSPQPTCDVTIVTPVFDRVPLLLNLLRSLRTQQVLIVDDGSADPAAILDAARPSGAIVTRHDVNRGPAAARNTGLRAASTDAVAFIDSDCTAQDGYPASLLFHFADPTVAAVAPRVEPRAAGNGLLLRYEAGRSSLDMGARPELVRPRARLGFVPSAALIVRRQALGEAGFDEGLRLGEDVDLIWRLTEAGWQVRYDPSVRVCHEPRIRPRDWLVRRFEYGTSAADLSRRHPGHLTPARVSSWNLAAIALAATGHPAVAAGVTSAATIALARQLRDVPDSLALAARTVGQGLVADGAAIGHLLRREWWPVGLLALAAAPRSRTARLASLCMIAPIAWEWATERPRVDPVRYGLLRLLDDAAYGTGVITSSVRARTGAPLLPLVRMPRLPGSTHQRS